MIIFSFLVVLLILYCCLILVYAKWYIAIKPFEITNSYTPSHSFSVIIPARNEATNIAKCINSICANNYPTHLYEIIVVDDYSEDETSSIVKQLQQQYSNLKLVKLNEILGETNLNSYKKKSIEIGIANAVNEFIICTDADCIVPKNWLIYFDGFLQKTRAVFVAAPVEFIKENSLLNDFQYIDFLAMQSITAAAVTKGFQAMCNGANMAYSRNVFYQVDGFKNIDNIASGDDMLLMQKIKAKFPTRVGYLFAKEAVVKTPAAPSIKEFLNQRIRWASKSKNYKDFNVLLVLLLVYLLNISLALGFIIGLFNISLLVKIFLLIVLKSGVEFYFLDKSKNMFSGFSYLKFLVLQPFHMVYIILAGWLGYFKKYEWKGRKVQ
jgi:cellulose synthase/poly-beta-1,6-N-acetylglucosamine synthase-like glycosyltransferase